MTVSRTLSSLNIFQYKVGEALNLVPAMSIEDKLKAVHFWNIVSEKLQDIVNSSAADINAVAMTMEEVEGEKLNLGISTEANHMVTESTVPSTEFSNLSTIYAIPSDTSVQYHSSLSNNHLKPFTSDMTLFPNSNKQSSFNEVSSRNHQLLSANSDLQNSSIQTGQDIVMENVSINSCDNSCKDNQTMDDLPFSEIKKDCNKNNDKFLSSKKNVSHSHSLLKEKLETVESTENLYSVIIESKNSVISEKCNSFNQESMSEKNKQYLNSKTSNVDSGDLTKEDSLPTQNVDETSEPSLERMPERDISNSEEIINNIEDNKQISDCIKNDNGGLICKICFLTYPDEDSLTRHHLRAHERHYSCSECKAKFSTKSNLLVHMRRHTGEKPFCCHKCSAHFSTNGNLQRHIRTHSGSKPWQCNKCDSCFTEKKSLTIHMRRHTGEKPYQCKECGKCFSQTSILQTHMSMHLDTKMHLCEICGKCFRQKSQLRVHKLRHDNIRPFSCPICSFAYITRGDLLRHEKTHTTEKPYKCDVCSKGFTRQQSLNEHKNRHYGIKPYKCKHCGKAFPEMSGCYKHMKIHKKANDTEDNNKEQNNECNIEQDNDPEPEPAKIAQEMNSNMPTDQNITENKISNVPEAPSYIAVVLNAKHPNELGDEINQAVSFLNSGLEENSIVPNGIGVLTAINILTNASAFPQAYQNIS